MLAPKCLVKKCNPLQLKGKYWNRAKSCKTGREKLGQEEVTLNTLMTVIQRKSLLPIRDFIFKY